MGFDVVGLGLNATDVAIEVPRYPAFNSKIEFTSAHLQAGGQVATALVVCQRLGLKTKYIGRVGDDPMGQFQLESLRPEGIDLTDLVVVHNCPNQCAYIVIEEQSGERTILWRRDPRLTIRPEDLRREMVTGARLVHVDGHDTATTTRLAAWAREAGLPVTVDVDNLYPGLPALLDSTTHLISSAPFPSAYAGEEDYFHALPEIRRRHRGMKLVAATMGQDGVLAYEDGQFIYAPAFAVRCRDTTGAGDVFHGAFAFGLLQQWPTMRILEFSNAVAALNCQSLGARGGIPSQSAAEELIAHGPRHAPRWPELVGAVGGSG